MSMSGIDVDPAVGEIFNEVKLRSTQLYVTFKISGQRVVIAEKGSLSSDWNSFVETLKKAKSEGEGRYAIYDVKFDSQSGRHIEKLAFMFWCPDDLPMGAKMKYSSTKDTVRNELRGLSLEFQFNSEGDLDFESIRAEVERKA